MFPYLLLQGLLGLGLGGALGGQGLGGLHGLVVTASHAHVVARGDGGGRHGRGCTTLLLLHECERCLQLGHLGAE